MPNKFITLFNDTPAHLRAKIGGIYILLIAANVGAWVWAFVMFHGQSILLGTALLAYTFGLRHAVDADHIAAIDNVTRKLMQEGKRPVSVGLFFSMGHASVVCALSVGIGFAATALQSHFEIMKSMGGVISTIGSAGFLFLIAFANILILISVFRTFHAVKRGEALVENDFDLLLNKRGLLSRVFRPLFRMVTRSWHLFPIGILFGLGFDTATEVALFGISSSQAAHGMTFWSIMVFPALFSVGMSLIDTTDGILMLGAYGWAFLKPIRKIYYNMTITFVSVVVAVVIGGIETLGLIGDQFKMTGPVWDSIGMLNDNFGVLGYIVIGVFVVSWLLSMVIYRVRRYDDIVVEVQH